jgi:phage terminase large subunit-like protein
VRDRAERGEPELGYIAYGVDADPAEIDAEDPALWAVANPAYGITIFDDTLRRARRATTRAGFISEHLGVWPDTGRTSPISHEAWRGLVDVDDPLDVDRPIDVAFDVAADGGTASVVAAGTSQSGRRALRLLHYDDAPELWLIERLDELIREGRRVCYDARAFGRDYVDELIRRGAKVADKATPHGLLVPANLDAHVTACLSLQADVKAGRLVHDGHHALETAVVYARTRKAGDGWVWDRHHGSHAPPIVAATLALWSVERRPSPRPRFAIL